jgi:YihY family inner membrane protein
MADLRSLRAGIRAAAQTVARILAASITGYVDDRCRQQAAAIAYRVLFSIVPLAIVLVWIFGAFVNDKALEQTLVDAIVGLVPVTPGGRRQVEEAITAMASPTSAASAVALLAFVYAATGMMSAIQTGLATALRVSASRPMARAKLVDLILVLGAGSLVLATVGVTLLGRLSDRISTRVEDASGLQSGPVLDALSRGLWFALAVVVVMLLYRFVPARRLSIRAALVGAVATGVLLLAISLASGFIYAKLASQSLVYGSLTVALVFLYSVYLYASAMLFGAEIAGAWSRPADPSGPSIRDQVKDGVAGLFVTRRRSPDTPG